MTMTDSVLDRARRVRHSLEREGDPATVQAVVDGPCPECGARDIVTVHGDTARFECAECETTFIL